MKIQLYEEDQLAYFPLYARTCGIHRKQEDVVRPNGYPLHQLLLVNSGNGVLKIGGSTYILSENDMFYIAANTPNEYYGTDGSFTTSFLGFQGSGFDSIRAYYGLGDYGVYPSKGKGVFSYTLSKLYNSFNVVHETSTLCALCFSAVLTYFDEACKKEYSPTEAVMHYIEANYGQPITLEDILSAYPHSKSKLCRDFKESYGMTVFEMLTAVRLRHANYMLRNDPNMKLSKVAQSCGFQDVSYFCRMYKRFYGCSPKRSIQ